MRSAWKLLIESSVVMATGQLKDDVDDFKTSFSSGDEPERRQMFAVIVGDIVELAKAAQLTDAADALEELERKLFKLPPKKAAEPQKKAEPQKLSPAGVDQKAGVYRSPVFKIT